jgi:hypothetical protein
MRGPVAAVVFDGWRSRVDELLAARVPMSVVECMIDAYALDREAKDALWLWASARRDRLKSGASEHLNIAGTARTQVADALDTPGYPMGAGHD